MKPIVKGSFITGSLAALAAVSITANVLMYYRYSTSRPLVTVGSQVITKKAYQDALDYQTQGAVLKKLVLADLINQAAAKAGVTPSDADVNTRLDQIRRTEPQVLAGAEQDPTRLAMFKEDLRTQIALENLQIQNVPATDTEVAAYYQQHKAQFALPAQVRTTLIVAQNAVDASAAANLLREDIALDIVARQPRLEVVGMNGFNINWSAMPRATYRKISSAVFSMKPGDVKTIAIGEDYVTMRAAKTSGAGVPPLEQIRPQVTRLVKLQKGAPAAVEMTKLYQSVKPQFSVARYADYFNDLSHAVVAQNNGATKTASAE